MEKAKKYHQKKNDKSLVIAFFNCVILGKQTISR